MKIIISILIGSLFSARRGAISERSSSLTQHVDTFNSSDTWTCPAGVTSIDFVEAYGAGGGIPSAGSNPSGGGGGGAYAKRNSIPVTPGQVYTVTVGAGVAAGVGGTSSFTGDSSVTCSAVGGQASNTTSGHVAPGGAAASCVGDITASGGGGGAPSGTHNGGGGGGASGNIGTGTGATGAAGGGGVGTNTGGSGGVGANGGGSGGNGGTYSSDTGRTNGTSPGGGAGGHCWQKTGSQPGASGRVILTYMA